ncbi:hypothetical protein N7456_002554 [Penicillium angulare]|uniref:DUF7136 domain-containing protein n=1 Tax=Penicillium angulare TaxID=116970 RepID=A0A9W9G9C2_9EURO|nr:hypothetical protein N7456_002554 [Penicillium angulare]
MDTTSTNSSVKIPTPQTTELDLFFPKNATYAPNQDFPLLWGLQNADLAWDMRMRLSWELDRLDKPLPQPETGIFPRQNYSGPISNYTTYGKTPADPLFLYYFPDALRNISTGEWKLSWKFGFYLTCSKTNYSEQPLYQFDRLQPTELIFSVSQSGEELDLLALGNSSTSCTDTANSSSITYHIIDYETELSGNCPILNQTSLKATPCALSFNQTLVDEIEGGAVANCSSGDWDRFVNTCQTGGAAQILPHGYGLWGVMLFVLVLSIIIV